MGGKHKMANRTKNNARPSNSSRSAELLGSSLPPFSGFSPMKDASFGGFSLTNTDNLEASIDSNYQLILKKLAKKDATTKLKGLQELAELVKASEPDVVKSVLPLWPRYYSSLATDTDNRVREATHNALYQIVLKVKRNIAPFLKQLMAPWFTSQYDTYPPAASVATQAFKDTFPGQKFQEAIIFCQEEILLYIKENLIEQNAQTIMNSKTATTEESEAKYERVLISCLQGYYLYLTKVSMQQIEQTADLNNDIVSNSKFWILAKHKIAPIRAAWFEVLAALCQHALILLENKTPNVVVTVFNNLDETDPIVLPHVWESALLIMSSIKEWWTFINIEKLFLPKLNKVLKQGAQGTATVIYPNLLPLLSHLPPNIDANTFYTQFFENLRLSLKQRNVSASRSESVAITTAIFECLQYVILKNQNDLDLCKNLISQHVIATIEWALLNNQACHKTIFNKVSSLAQYWSRQQTQNANYATLLDYFFQNILELIGTTLRNKKQETQFDVSEVTSKQIDLLQCLKHVSKNSKHNKVQFKETDDVNVQVDDAAGSVITPNDPYLEKLHCTVYAIAEEYIQYIQQFKCKDLIKHFYSLILDFNAKKFFGSLTRIMGEKQDGFGLLNIFKDVLHKWLTTPELCCQSVVDLIFLLFNNVDTNDQEFIMTTLSKVKSKECLGWCISQALSHPINKNPIIQNWLQNDKVSNFIVSIADMEIMDECTPDLSVLFKLALTENENGDLFIQKQAITTIIDKLVDVLEHEQEHIVTFDSCCSLASYISAIVYTENLLLSYDEKLLLALFKLSCKHNFDPDIMSPETVYEINSAWEDVVSLLSSTLEKTEFIGLTKRFADTVEEYFSSSDLSVGVIQHLTDVVGNYIKACQRSVPFLNDIYLLFINQSFVPIQNAQLTRICKNAEYIKGSLSSPYDDINCGLNVNEFDIYKHEDNYSDININEFDIYKYFVWAYFKLNVVLKNLSSGEDEEEEDECESDQNLDIILNILEKPEETAAEMLYDYTLCSIYLEDYKNVKYYYDIRNYHNLVDSQLKELLTNRELAAHMKAFLKEKVAAESWLWSKSVYLLYKEITPKNLPKIYREFTYGIPEGLSLSRIHLTQLFGHCLSFDYIQKRHDNVESVIVLRSLLHCDEIDVQIAEVFRKMEDIRSEHVPQFLYESHNISWNKTQEIIESVRLCLALISKKMATLSRRHWDFGVLSLAAWASNCFKARVHYQKLQVQAMISAVAEFYADTEKQMFKFRQTNPNSYANEWRDVFLEMIHGDLAQLWLYFADQFEAMPYEHLLKYLPFIQEFGKVVSYLKHDYIFKFNESSLPKWTKFLKKSCSLVCYPLPTLQLWGYKMLIQLVPGLIQIDFEAVQTNTPHKKGLIFEQFKEKLVQTHEIVNSMLMDFKLGEDSCTVKHSTDSFTYTFAYLLLWDVLLQLCEKSVCELRYQYGDWLRNEDLLKIFLNNLFRLMPMEVLQYSEGKAKSLLDVFQENPNLSIKGDCNSEKIEKMACWLYARAIEHLPAVVRQWWSAVDTKLAQIVDRITSIYVSPPLCTKELNDISNHEAKFRNMTVKVVPSVREVIAVYTVDDSEMELLITLPPNYPLCGPEVEFSKQVGLPTHRQWVLQFKKCVLYQNASIWDGLSLWHTHLEKKFEGVEECYICFCTLHPGTYQLPKLSCSTCKKKFHSACLYKWFSTSNKSTCPICRNLF